MEVGKKVFVARECLFGTLYVYGEGVYIGDFNLIDEEKGSIIPGKPRPCIELDSGYYFFEGIMQGRIGTKEEVYASYEGLYAKIREVKPDGLSVSLKPLIDKEKQIKPMEVLKPKNRRQPMVIFAKSRDGRVTIAGIVTEIDETNKKCKIALGFAKQRKTADPINRRKLARQIARGRAAKNPFLTATVDYGAHVKAVQLKIEDVQSSPSQSSVIVSLFKKTFEPLAEDFANAPLPAYVCEHYKLKTIENDKSVSNEALA